MGTSPRFRVSWPEAESVKKKTAEPKSVNLRFISEPPNTGKRADRVPTIESQGAAIGARNESYAGGPRSRTFYLETKPPAAGKKFAGIVDSAAAQSSSC